MTYDQIFQRNQFLSMFPLGSDNYSFSSNAATAIILLQVEFNKRVQEYEADMQEALKKLKKEGFDDRAKAIAEMEAIDNMVKAYQADPTKPQPTHEDIAKAEEIRKTESDYRNEYEELEKKWIEVRSRKGAEEVPNFNPKLDKKDYEDIVKAIGVVGDMELPNVKEPIPKTAFLLTVAEFFT